MHIRPDGYPGVGGGGGVPQEVGPARASGAASGAARAGTGLRTKCTGSKRGGRVRLQPGAWMHRWNTGMRAPVHDAVGSCGPIVADWSQ
jgi:hypothetical protein